LNGRAQVARLRDVSLHNVLGACCVVPIAFVTGAN
jgi:hypothetical protein